LLLDLVQNADLGAVLPVPAAQQLSKERFAQVSFPGIETLRRELMLVYQQRNYDLREPVRRVATRLPKLLKQ
jgi:hypothetical protein